MPYQTVIVMAEFEVLIEEDHAYPKHAALQEISQAICKADADFDIRSLEVIDTEPSVEDEGNE